MFCGPIVELAPENTILGSKEEPVLGVIKIFLSDSAICCPVTLSYIY
jgi:hypothetical protein